MIGKQDLELDLTKKKHFLSWSSPCKSPQIILKGCLIFLNISPATHPSTGALNGTGQTRVCSKVSCDILVSARWKSQTQPWQLEALSPHRVHRKGSSPVWSPSQIPRKQLPWGASGSLLTTTKLSFVLWKRKFELRIQLHPKTRHRDQKVNWKRGVPKVRRSLLSGTTSQSSQSSTSCNLLWS